MVQLASFLGSYNAEGKLKTKVGGEEVAHKQEYKRLALYKIE